MFCVPLGWFDEIALHVILHYTLYILLVLFEKPESQVSVGLHEPTGNCNQTTNLYTALGQVRNVDGYMYTALGQIN